MDLADEAVRAELRAALGAPLRGRPLITGLAPLAAFTSWVPMLRDIGARPPLVLAIGRGAGPVPDAGDAEVVWLDIGRFPSMTEELRRHDGLARDLPGAVRAAVQAHDPDGKGVWLFGPFVTAHEILGRPVHGGRPAQWMALEDKLLAEDVWRAVGAPHVPAHVVLVDLRQATEAGESVDLGHGVVWAGDARDGFNGGGEFTRWVVTDEDRAEALAFFGPRCDRVRVMPFLDGVPCSIHGIVLPDGTAAFRPVELAILRGSERRFVYGGQGSTWDPPEADRAEMRDLVRHVGEHLRHRVGYRGAFGIDGVLTTEGFRPTELNTRMAGGLSTLSQGVDGDLFVLLQMALATGHDPGVGVEALEQWALPAMDAERVSKVIAVTDTARVEDNVDIPVTWDGATLTRSPGSEAAVTVGPTAIGTYARVTGDLVAPGERIAPLNAALILFLDAELGTRFGPVEIAPDRRSR